MRAAAIAVIAAIAACARDEGVARHAAPRVVSLHDVTTEIVVALGAADRLVGVQQAVDLPAAAAAAVARVPVVGDLESILVARPDVVLGLEVVAESSPELVAALRERGVVVELADPATLRDVAALVRAIARRVDAADRADAIAAPFDRAASAPLPASQLPVLVYDCCEPPFTAGGRTVLTDVIAHAGGRNVFADLDADWAGVSWEAAAARRPALVVVHAYGGATADKIRALRAVPGLERVPVVEMPLAWSLGGLGSLRALERLTAAIREAR
jgi:iron complex transport system substrate-binding protein